MRHSYEFCRSPDPVRYFLSCPFGNLSLFHENRKFYYDRATSRWKRMRFPSSREKSHRRSARLPLLESVKFAVFLLFIRKISPVFPSCQVLQVLFPMDSAPTPSPFPYPVLTTRLLRCVESISSCKNGVSPYDRGVSHFAAFPFSPTFRRIEKFLSLGFLPFATSTTILLFA